MIKPIRLIVIYSIFFLPIVIMAHGRKKVPSYTLETDSPMVHDPVMAFEDNIYHMYSTGWGIQHMTSEDMENWQIKPTPLMTVIPGWTKDSVSGFQGHVWAPDIIRWHNRWYMAFSCSTFGRNSSAIGLLSNNSLDDRKPWTDNGCIISSRENRNDWNAIDPNFIIDESDTPWLTFGSFWSGIQIIKLDSTMHMSEGWHPQTIARRYALNSNNMTPNPTSKYAGVNAIEAPFIFHHGGYYYLFVSWDYCCQGKKSTYRVAVGRSKNVTGPYVDSDGKPMLQGGGSIIAEGDKKDFEAMGHCAIYHIKDKDIFICHGYSIALDGVSILLKYEINWSTDGWPSLTPFK